MPILKAKIMCVKNIWIFGYGSLIWQPGFQFCHSEIARLKNYKRSFCMWSIHYRGTPKHMGLVLALDNEPRSYCDGLAFKVDEDNADNILAYLRKRELISDAYLEVKIDIELISGHLVSAYTYVINRNHEQYAKDLSIKVQADTISSAVGINGPNSDYLFNITKCLRDLKIEDPELEELSNKTLSRI